MQKIKQNLIYIFTAGFALLQFLFMFLPYLKGYISMEYGVVFVEQTGNISGYKMLDLWQGGFAGIMCSLLQIFTLLTATAMLVYGLCGVFKTLGNFQKFPETMGKTKTKTVGEILWYIYAGLQVLLLIFSIVLISLNQVVEKDVGAVSRMGLRFGAGFFLTFMVCVIGFVVYKLLDKQFSCNQKRMHVETQNVEQQVTESKTEPNDDAS